MKDKIFLLSFEEVRELPFKYLEADSWWWLRSTGYSQHSAADVSGNGGMDYYGCDVDDEAGGVRPAIRLDNTDIGLSIIDDKLYYLGIEWVKISKYLNEPDIYLAKRPIFYDKFDDESNNYNSSYIRTKLLNWYKEAKENIQFLPKGAANTICNILIDAGQADTAKFHLGDIIKYTPTEVRDILKKYEKESANE